jgi:hypothetical protein
MTRLSYICQGLVKAEPRENCRVATWPNETCAMDFVFDQLATGHKLLVLTSVDTYSRFSLALRVTLLVPGGIARNTACA